MQTQHNAKPSVLLVMITMVLCIVFASSLKVALDLTNTTKKVTSQQILEEEPNEKDCKIISKEVYNKLNSFSETIKLSKINIISNGDFYSVIKITSPYLKVHTLPPDSFCFFS